MTLTLRYAAISDRGLIRSGNQDSVYAGPRLIAVADGMGGMAAGDIASSIVIGALAPLDDDVPRGELTSTLADAVEESNARIREMVEEHPEMEGMGTTLTAFLFSGSLLGMAHVGDSRAYRLRDSSLLQLTKDDTYVQMLVDDGRITADEAESHPQRSLLLRALGSNEVETTFATLEAASGDRYLLCSDGLSGVVSDETIAETLRDVADPHEAADRLVQLALRGGGPDNVTVLVADVSDAEITESEPIIAGAAAAADDSKSSADPSSAAARAAATTAVEEPDAADDSSQEPADTAGTETKKRSGRAKWYALAVVLVLLVASSLGYLVYQGQYYVGVNDDDNVAVFQGFNSDLFGYSLSSVETVSDRSVKDLTPNTQQRLESGIQADGLQDAHRIMDEITNSSSNLLDPCPTPDDSSSSEPSESGDETPEPGVDCRPTD
ncbi:MAG TPA: protein phosphatase 2C domain-containing protein [Candidatus Stackebrandtia faecavium]|nr:protein phosphatase 2C domain-containing protein [Candidatus Stackebrandtia faecavium]